MHLSSIKSRIKGIFNRKNGYFSGPYPSWAQAVESAYGYDDPSILAKIKEASLQVKNNPRLFARDGMVFSTPQYSHPLLSALLKVAIEKKGPLNVVDFGGGLGSSYYALRNYCPAVELKWFVVEQPNFVEYGNQFLRDDALSFYSDLSSLSEKIDIIVLSGTLQYIDQPYHLLKQILALKAPYFLLDRTWFNEKADQDQIVVEHVPEHIYKSSYPCWLLSYKKLKEFLDSAYQVIFEFDALEGKFFNNGFNISSKGIFYGRNK